MSILERIQQKREPASAVAPSGGIIARVSGTQAPARTSSTTTFGTYSAINVLKQMAPQMSRYTPEQNMTPNVNMSTPTGPKFATNTPPVPVQPKSAVVTVAKAAPGAIASGVTSYADARKEKLSGMSFGEQTADQLVKEPARIIGKLGGAIAGGLSTIGKTMLETVGTYSRAALTKDTVGEANLKMQQSLRGNETQNAIEKKLFGFEAESYGDWKPAIEKTLNDMNALPVEKKVLPVLLPMLGLMADLAPGGQSKKSVQNAIEGLVKATDEAAVEQIAKKMGVPETVAKQLAPELAKATDPEQVKTILQRGISREADVVSDELAQTAKSVVPDRQETISSFLKQDGAKVIDPDRFKKIYNDFDPKNHNTYGEMADDAFKQGVEQVPNKTVKFTAGGSGSGKSELLLKNMEKDFDGLIMDGTFKTYKNAREKLDMVLNAGKTPEVYAIVPRIESAWKFAQKRGIITDRNVPLDVFVDAHTGMVDTIKRLIQDGDVKIYLKDTRSSWTKGEAKNAPFITDPQEIFAKLDELKYNKDELKQTLQHVKLSEKSTRKAIAARESRKRAALVEGGAMEVRRGAVPGDAGRVAGSNGDGAAVPGPSEGMVPGGGGGGTGSKSRGLTTDTGVPGKLAQTGSLPRVEQRAVANVPDVANKLDEYRASNRGVISDEVAYETARSLGITEQNILNMPVGTILTKEEKTAVSGIVQNAVETLRSLEKNLPQALLTPDDIASQRIIQEFAMQKMKVMKLLAVERGIAAETGRALQAHKMLAQAISDEEARIAKFLADPKVPKDAKDFVLDQIAKHGNDPEQMKDLLKKLHDATLMEMFVEFSTAIKLYGIPTHLVNAITTATRVAIQVPLRGISAGTDAFIATLRGRARERFTQEITLEAAGQLQGYKDSWRHALKAIQNEDYIQEVRKIQDFQPKGPAIKGRLGKNGMVDRFMDSFGKGVRMSFRFLGAEDIFFRMPAQQGAAYVLVGRAAMKKGLKPGTQEYADFIAKNVFEPDAKILEDAVKTGDEVLFQSPLSPGMQAVNQIREKMPAVKLIVPFFRTLNNLVKQAIEFSPLAPSLPSVRTALNTPGASSDAIAKMALGTSVIVPLTIYAMEDKITLGAPKSAAERDAFYAEGKQPYSLRIGDTWYPYARFSPFSEWFTTAGLMAQAIKNDDEKTLTELTRDAFFTMSQNVLDKTFVSGLNDALQALTDPNKAGTWLENFVTGATIPTIVGGAARSIDPVVREVDSIADAYRARIPGLSDNLPARTDVFGNDIMRPGTPVSRFFSPVIPSPVKVDLVRGELKEMDYNIGFPGKSAFGFEMDDTTHREMQTVAGKITYNVLYDMMASPGWDKMTPSQKEETVQKVVNKVRARVKEQVAPQYEMMKKIKDRLVEKGMADDDAEKKAEEIVTKMLEEQEQ